MRHFLISFHRSPPQILLEMKRFVIIKDSLGFSALCDLPETFTKKKFEKILIFFFNFSFFEKFSVEKMLFLLVFAVSSWVKSSLRVPSVSLRVFLAL